MIPSREDIRCKKLLPFGHFPKVAFLDTLEVVFFLKHIWGNNTQLKLPQNYSKITQKLCQNFWSLFTPLPTYCPKRKPKNYLKTFGFGLNPNTPLLENVQKEAAFTSDVFPQAVTYPSNKIVQFRCKADESQETSLLRMLQARTIPDATPPTGKIHPFSKIGVTFGTVMRFGCLLKFRIS